MVQPKQAVTSYRIWMQIRISFCGAHRAYFSTVRAHRKEKMRICAKKQQAGKLCLTGGCWCVTWMLDCFRVFEPKLLPSTFLVSLPSLGGETLKQTNPFNPALPPRFSCGIFGDVTDIPMSGPTSVFTRTLVGGLQGGLKGVMSGSIRSSPERRSSGAHPL